ncbi:MAG: regulatory protein GemA [Lachnospiraceae bacterium]|nr:regulatory protein GemA [Lachnospiraceae bacterium]
MGKVISVSQMRKIYALARERGMDSDLLHAHMQALTEKESMKELTMSEGIRMIESLEGKPTELKGQIKASYKQMQYIYGLMKRLGWVTGTGEPDTERLDRFLQSPKAGINLGSYKWLTKEKASKLIEALKSISERTNAEDKECTSCGEGRGGI